MDALLSAWAGTAVLIDGPALFSIHAGSGGEAIPCRAEEFHLIFGEGQDLQILRNVSRDEVARQLEAEADARDALQLSLILLDPEAADDIRQEAAVELEDYLGRGNCRERMERVLYAHPLPEDGDLDGALAHSEGHAPRAHQLIRDFASLQPEIDEVFRAWLEVPDSQFESEADRRRFQAAAVREGVFRGFVLARREGTSIDPLLLDALLKSAIRAIQGYRQILLTWGGPLKLRRKKRWDVVSEVAEATTVSSWESRRSFDRQKAFTKVETQKNAIVQAMEARNLGRARRYVEDLVKFNLSFGGPKYTVKSLCDLAMRAKDLGLAELQMELTQRAVEVEPDDGWAWAQYGDALLSNDQHDAALNAFTNASAFGSVAGGTGQGEVLRSLGRFEASIAAYDAVIERFPDNVVARDGRAETLRDSGRLDEALAAYDEVIQRFPDDVYARTGRAETLRDSGRLDEALAAYEDVIWRFPDNVVARNGRAESLRSLGRLEAALAAYDQIIEQFPSDLVARNGRASVLAIMGLSEKALEKLPNSTPSHPQDWIGYHIRGMLLLRLGRLEEAERILCDGVENCPFPLQRDYFRSALATLRLKRKEYPAAVAVLDDLEMATTAPPVDLLRLHALGAEGEREKAVVVERRLRSAQPSAELDEVREELSRRYIQHLSPKRSEEWIVDREILILLAAVGTYLLRRRRAF